jgi:fructokinase
VRKLEPVRGKDTGAVARVAAPTTLSLVGVDAQGMPSYAFYGEGGADRQLHAADLACVPGTLGALNLGSYATVVEPIAFDPNIRLNVEPDLQRWRDRLA